MSRYRRKVVEVAAVRLPIDVYDADGHPVATEGDWHIKFPGGHEEFLDDASFNALYEPIEDMSHPLLHKPHGARGAVLPGTLYAGALEGAA